MKKKVLLVFATMLGIGMVHAQKAYTYVQQNGTKLDALGTAAFNLSSKPTVEFCDGKAVMSINGNTVAKLPMSDGGQLVVDFTTTMADADLNKVTKTLSNDYATIYSPFQLKVTSGNVEVYIPEYDSENHVLKLKDEKKVEAEYILPVETALILKKSGNESEESVTLAISDGASSSSSSALSGSSLKIVVPSVESGNTLYTLGHKTGDSSSYGFYSYTGSTLWAGLAYLIAPTVPASDPGAKAISFAFDDATAIDAVQEMESRMQNGKFLENGRIVIVKNSKKYNLNGQEVK